MPRAAGRPPRRLASGRATLGLAAALAVLVVFAYRGVLDNGFVDFDDDQYVTLNPALRGGLTPAALRWAFTTGYAANWHPLTWLSHLLDVELYGLAPRGHHLTSLLLHVAGTLALFLLLRSLTRQALPSALAAALFGLHPLHVESVAWVAERKDVLSTLLGFCAIAAYASWARRPSAARYGLLLVLYALGLMAKPMLVTLPFALVLLDVWPLRRLELEGPALAFARQLGRRLAEKSPLFALAAASSVVTFLVQRAGGAMRPSAVYPLGVRVQNAVVACAEYLRDLAWPARLAVFYPHPGASIPIRHVVLALALLAGVSAAAWRLRRRLPAVLVGWLWFLGTLVPVSGLVQVGWQGRADRYTYLPSVGLFVAVAWAGAHLATTRARRAGAAALAAGVLLCLTSLTRAQVARWHDSETLFRHALAVTRENFLAHNNLGHYYNNQDRPLEALAQLEAAIQIRPGYGEAYTNLGRSQFLLGRLDEAWSSFQKALSFQPEDPVTLNNLGFTRLRQGDLAEAEAWYRKALAAAPDWAELHYKLGLALWLQERVVEAHPQLDRAAQLDPTNALFRDLAAGSAPGPAPPEFREGLARFLAKAHRDVGLARFERQDLAGAGTHYARAVALDPADAQARNDLGYVLLLQGQRDEAVAQFREALRLRPDLELPRNNLALALQAPRR